MEHMWSHSKNLCNVHPWLFQEEKWGFWSKWTIVHHDTFASYSINEQKVEKAIGEENKVVKISLCIRCIHTDTASSLILLHPSFTLYLFLLHVERNFRYLIFLCIQLSNSVYAMKIFYTKFYYMKIFEHKFLSNYGIFNWRCNSTWQIGTDVLQLCVCICNMVMHLDTPICYYVCVNIVT